MTNRSPGWLTTTILAMVGVGTALLVDTAAAGTKAVPAPGAPRPTVWSEDWRCKNETEKSEGKLTFKIGLRHLPAVSVDGHLALGIHELVEDQETDHPPPFFKVTPDVEWRSDNRVVVYFVNLDTGRAEPPTGLHSAPVYFSEYRPCAHGKRSVDRQLAKVNGRLDSRPWATLHPLAVNLDEPDRRDDWTRPTLQKRKLGAAAIEFRFPKLTIRYGETQERSEVHKLALAGYPSRDRADEPFGLLELETRGSGTWLTDLWIEPVNGVLVLRLMNKQFSDCVLGNAFDYFLRVSREEADALCPDCAKQPR